MIDKTLLDEVIIGRVEPHIYAFTTNTIPNYLKVGDTYRPVSIRLKEWEEYFPKLEQKYEATAKITDDIYFRDFAVHKFLEEDKKRERLQPTDIDKGVYYSREFFKDATAEDIIEAIKDIQDDFNDKTQKYQFYNAVNRLAETITFERNENYPTRPNQDKTISNFKTAIANGRNNLLMYAVMRFGKSFTSMCCALEMDAKLVVIVSAKADVKFEWKKTVESHVKFADYDFLTSEDLMANNKAIKDKLTNNRKVAIFLTLQDLQGETIKDKHKELFGEQIDLLLIDETHFGARAEKYGQVLKANKYEKDITNKKDTDDFVDVEDAEEQLKVLNAKIRLHLSGTPYRILMGSEFKKEDIIAFYQFTDIVKEQQKWIEENNKKPENLQEEDWANPYYGFPQMVRFAFNPNESSRKRLEELRKNGISYAFSALLKPKSIKKTDNGDNKKFVFEQEVLDLLEVIDGSKEDDELLGFLDYDKIKEGKMCRHIVMVLPYCASCDAIEELIKNNKEKFKNLNSYEIVNISGVENPNKYKTTMAVKKAISEFERQGKKTITLTVNRMLTGSTVKEWDTMLYLKDTSSPQEYDQAIFRLQNQYIKTYETEDGKKIKYNMKPQTLLVDFMPNRMFVMQEQKAQIYNVNIDDGGNNKLKQRIEEELKISPIITLNSNKITQVQATDILEVVSNYKMDKGIKDEALEIPVDLGVLDIPEIKAVIEKENEIGSKFGLSTPAHKSNDETDDGSDIDTPPTTDEGNNDDNTNSGGNTTPQDDEKKRQISLTKKIQSYYTRILLFAFITNNAVASLKEIVDVLDSAENKRIANNLGLEKEILKSFYDFYFSHNKWALRDLDYKIQDLNSLSHKDSLPPEEKAKVAVNKFGKLGDAVVITPSNICNDMIALLPNDVFENGNRILDIAGVSGEFATATVKKMTELGVESEIIKDFVYTIPKTSICYELTRKVYEMLKLNVNNIALFYSEDLLKIKNGDGIDYDKIKKLISQNKPFNEITLEDNVEGVEEKDMLQFNAVVGNPPYQANTLGNNKGFAPPIYHFFMNIAFGFEKNICMIHPARFLFDGGSTPKEWNKSILNNTHIKVANYFPNSITVFNDINIMGGIAITYYNINSVFEKIGNYIAYDEIKSVLKKVKDKFIESIDTMIYPAEAYRFSEVMHTDFPQIASMLSDGHKYDLKTSVLEKLNGIVFTDNITSDDYIIWGIVNNKKTAKNIKKKYINPANNIQGYKVLLPKSNGSSSIGQGSQTQICGFPFVVGKNNGHTQSYMSFGCFNSKNEAENLCKYIKSKFARFLLGILKITQDNPKSKWKYVPLQDFTDKSDIDWSKTIPEIDEQLYKKYGLTDEEKAFIEKMIKPME